MPINANIEGNPETFRSAANWLRQQLSKRVDGANDKVYSARNRAAGGLRGEAADRLHDKLTRGGREVDDFVQDMSTAAQHVDATADTLQQAQQHLEQIRSEAARAGLTVSGSVTHEPGPAPPAPGPAPSGAHVTPADVDKHKAAQQAQAEHQAKVAAYNKAKKEVEDVHRRWSQHAEQRSKEWQTPKTRRSSPLLDLASPAVPQPRACTNQFSKPMRINSGYEPPSRSNTPKRSVARIRLDFTRTLTRLQQIRPQPTVKSLAPQSSGRHWAE